MTENFERKLEKMMTVGERIAALRKEKKLSQGALAEAVGVSRQAVSKWENGLSNPDTEKLMALAEVLETEVVYLTTGEKPVYEHPVVVNMVEKVDRVVERVVEKPVVKKVTRVQYVRNPMEFGIVGAACFLLGLLIGGLIF